MRQGVVSTVVTAFWSAVVIAQSGGTMDNNETMSKMNHMGKMADATYIGCLETGSADGTFRLTHAVRPSSDSVKENAMKENAMKENAMKENAMDKSAMSHDMMVPTSLNLTSASVDLRKSVGRKVAITGSAPATMHKDESGMDASTFTVKTLKIVAASCS